MFYKYPITFSTLQLIIHSPLIAYVVHVLCHACLWTGFGLSGRCPGSSSKAFTIEVQCTFVMSLYGCNLEV